MFFFAIYFLIHELDYEFLIFITKNSNASGIFFFFSSILRMSPTLNGNVMYLKSSILEKALSTFVILAR